MEGEGPQGPLHFILGLETEVLGVGGDPITTSLDL